MTYLFGATSMLGFSLARGARAFVPFINTHAKATRPETRRWRRLNLEDERSVAGLFSDSPPGLLIHCGGVCDVEKCERSPQWAYALNVASVAALLRHLPRRTRLVYCSSDHVFGGRDEPYDESSPPEPLTVYGRTRVAAERLVLEQRPDALVLRTGLCIGASFDGRSGHLDWLRYRHHRGLPITVVQDEHRVVTWAEDLACRVRALAASNLSGIRHVTATHATSRPALAAYVNAHFDIGARFDCEPRSARRVPHLGHVKLVSRFDDELATPLPAVVPCPDRSAARATRTPSSPNSGS